MKRFKIDSLLILRCLFILVAVTVAALIMFFPTYSRYRKLREENIMITRKIEALRQEIDQLNRDISALEKDPYLMEKMARETLGVARENEIVIDIKD